MKIALGVNTLITLLKFKNFSFSLTLLLVITHLKKKTSLFSMSVGLFLFCK